MSISNREIPSPLCTATSVTITTATIISSILNVSFGIIFATWTRDMRTSGLVSTGSDQNQLLPQITWIDDLAFGDESGKVKLSASCVHSLPYREAPRLESFKHLRSSSNAHWLPPLCSTYFSARLEMISGREAIRQELRFNQLCLARSTEIEIVSQK